MNRPKQLRHLLPDSKLHKFNEFLDSLEEGCRHFPKKRLPKSVKDKAYMHLFKHATTEMATGEISPAIIDAHMQHHFNL
jgi:hypothetical protein